MAKRGRYADWTAELTPELRKQINDALDCEEEAASLHERLSLSPYCALRTLQAYARKRRKRVRITGEVGELVQSLTRGRTDFSDIQMVALGKVVESLMLPGVKPTAVARLAHEINVFERMTHYANRDEREEEAHEMRMRIGQLKTELQERAAEAAKPGAKLDESPAEAYARVARMLDEVITKRRAG